MTTPPPYPSHPVHPPVAPHGSPYGHPTSGVLGRHPAAEPTGFIPAQALPSSPLGCRVCGALPVMTFPIRAHQAFIFFMRFQKVDGPFCRPCGRAINRALTTKTLAQGWWSPLSLIIFTPLTLLWNLIAHRKINRLPRPSTAPQGTPLDEGNPMVRRPLAYVALAPAVWAVWALSTLITHST